jgi:hypothetical protein
MMGCSLMADRTTLVMSQVARRQPGTVHFALLTDSNNSRKRSAQLDKWNIRPLFFPDGKYELIEKFLSLLAEEQIRRGKVNELLVPSSSLQTYKVPTATWVLPKKRRAWSVTNRDREVEPQEIRAFMAEAFSAQDEGITPTFKISFPWIDDAKTGIMAAERDLSDPQVREKIARWRAFVTEEELNLKKLSSWSPFYSMKPKPSGTDGAISDTNQLRTWLPDSRTTISGGGIFASSFTNPRDQIFRQSKYAFPMKSSENYLVSTQVRLISS